MSDSQVSVEHRGAVAILRFANPPSGLIANKGAAQLAEKLGELLGDKEVRAIALTSGQEGVFIRHADVSQISRAADALAEGKIHASAFFDGPFPRLGRMLDAATKPVIAAIDGVCMGGGFEIALACTMRVASPAAVSIGLPEIRIGIFPGAGGTQRLPRLIGNHRAQLFMMRGTVVDATQALELGLVDELAPSALDRAVELANEFARRPPGAMAAIMRLTQSIDDDGLEEEITSFASLLRDDPAVREQLRQFVLSDQKIVELK